MKHFQASGMRAIDFPHRITRIIFRKIIFGSEIHEKNGKVKLFLATTKLFIKSGNVYIETKINVNPYIAFLCIPAWSYGGKIRIS